MKKRLLFVMFSLLLVPIFGQVSIPPQPSPPRLVNDFVNILKPAEIDSLEKVLVAYDNQTSIQILIVIVDYALASGSDEAFKIGDTWGVGQKELDNGVVLFIAIKSRKMFIATGKGIEDDLPDYICSRICNNTIAPYFKNGDYYEGISAGISEVQESLTSMSWADRTLLNAEKAKARQARNKQIAEFFVSLAEILFFLGLLGLLIWLICSIIQKSKKVAKKVLDLREQFEATVRDTPKPDSNWPKWALNEYNFLDLKYQDALKSSKESLNQLTEYFISRIFSNSSTVNETQSNLSVFYNVYWEIEDLHAKMIRYYRDASSKVDSANKLFVNCTTTIASNSNCDFASESADLKRIESEIATLVISGPDSYRNCYEKAESLYEQLLGINKRIAEHINARNDIGESLLTVRKNGDHTRTQEVKYILTFAKLSRFAEESYSQIDSPEIFREKLDKLRTNHQSLWSLWNNLPAVVNYFNLLPQSTELVDSLRECKESFDALESQVKKLHEMESGYPAKLLDAKNAASKVKSHSKQSEANDKITLAMAEAKSEKVNWIQVYKHLEEAIEIANEAIKIESESSDNSYDYSPTTRHYRSPSPSPRGGGGGGFGGFGGGSFGGGGGGGSW